VPEKEYLIRLGERARKRHYHKTEKGKLVETYIKLMGIRKRKKYI